MKVVAINGSPKKEGNTYLALKLVADELEKEGIDVEIIHVGGQVISITQKWSCQARTTGT